MGVNLSLILAIPWQDCWRMCDKSTIVTFYKSTLQKIVFFLIKYIFEEMVAKLI